MHTAMYDEAALAPQMAYGQVAGRRGDVFLVACSEADQPLPARQAASCLLRPETGDRVLLAFEPGEQGEHYVLAVLRRARSTPAHLELQGSARLHVEGGDLQISASHDLSLCAGEEAGIAAETVALHAARAVVGVERTRFLGKVLDIKVACVNRVVDTMNDVCRRLTRRLTHSLRFVREREEVQAGELRCVVEETLTMHAKNSLHVAEEIAKIDAGQVHLG